MYKTNAVYRHMSAASAGVSVVRRGITKLYTLRENTANWRYLWQPFSILNVPGISESITVWILDGAGRAFFWCVMALVTVDAYLLVTTAGVSPGTSRHLMHLDKTATLFPSVKLLQPPCCSRNERLRMQDRSWLCKDR